MDTLACRDWAAIAGRPLAITPPVPSRPVLRYGQLRDYDQLVDRIGRWRRKGNTAARIAAKLNSG